jgi:hypothetical protein
VSIPETLLTFVGAPAAIIAVITIAVLGPAQLRAPSRYRPGRPWPHAPAWYVPHPAVLAGHDAVAGEHGAAHAPELASVDSSRAQAVGGVSGEW